MLGPSLHPSAATLPPHVLTHFVQSLTEWLVGALSKKASAQQRAGGSLEAADPGQPCHDPSAWALLHVLTARGRAMLSGLIINAGLCSAAAAACTAACKQGSSPAAVRLAAAVGAAVNLLQQDYELAFRPSLEQQAALLEAVLKGLHGAAAQQQDVAPSSQLDRQAALPADDDLLPPLLDFAQQQLTGFLSLAASHPTPRKVIAMLRNAPTSSLGRAGRVAVGPAVARSLWRCG